MPSPTLLRNLVGGSAMAICVLASDGLAESRLRAELELGAVWQSKNDVQIPNEEEATRFSLVDLVGNAPTGAARLNLRWTFAEKQQLHVLLAPLQIRKTGTPDTEIVFAGESFEANEEVEATYRFNSWRLGYRYQLIDRPSGEFWLGFTGKLRDAEVRIEQRNLSAKDDDLGFVPLLHLGGRYELAPSWNAIVEVEGLAGGPGRAIDGTVQLRYGDPDGTGIRVGYRTVEGGADVDQVYNFAWLNYALVGLDLKLR